MTFTNENEYKFYRIATDKGFGGDVDHGPGLASTIFYESTLTNEYGIPYVIVSSSEGDTTNWNINYRGVNDIIIPQTIAFDVNIADKFDNTRSEEISITYSDNTPPDYITSQPLSEINSPISQSQVIATITGIQDTPDNDIPYTCSVFNNDGITINEHFVASTGSNSDTANFNISLKGDF